MSCPKNFRAYKPTLGLQAVAGVLIIDSVGVVKLELISQRKVVKRWWEHKPRNGSFLSIVSLCNVMLDSLVIHIRHDQPSYDIQPSYEYPCRSPAYFPYTVRIDIIISWLARRACLCLPNDHYNALLYSCGLQHFRLVNLVCGIIWCVTHWRPSWTPARLK